MTPPLPPDTLVRRAAYLKAAGYTWDTIADRLHVPAVILELFPADAPDWSAHDSNGCKAANDEFVADARSHARRLMRSEDEKTVLKAAELGIKFQMTLVRHHQDWRSPASELPPLYTEGRDPFAKVAELLNRWQQEDDEDEGGGDGVLRPKRPNPPPGSTRGGTDLPRTGEVKSRPHLSPRRVARNRHLRPRSRGRRYRSRPFLVYATHRGACAGPTRSPMGRGYTMSPG
ncbi:MAG: hypothetical protein ABGY75_22800 [Gemmataceae bacterium]